MTLFFIKRSSLASRQIRYPIKMAAIFVPRMIGNRTSYQIIRTKWRPYCSYDLITAPVISHSRNKDGGRNSILELKSVRILRLSGYRASDDQILTVCITLMFITRFVRVEQDHFIYIINFVALI
jgi:hypothetical protein